ncbi:hypothetical protein AB4Z48_03075 [Cupriavidus sp. 2TAF22]|uniref:hypothetical protein n=1 Tax=unclassified Cupriavidus TaxID=2640874 RepID=UPI003F8E34E0
MAFLDFIAHQFLKFVGKTIIHARSAPVSNQQAIKPSRHTHDSVAIDGHPGRHTVKFAIAPARCPHRLAWGTHFDPDTSATSGK